MPWKRRTLRLALGVILLVLVVAGGATLYLTQTRRGSQRVVEEVLGRLQDAMNGEIVVQRVTSARVLEGVTLEGVRIRGPRGGLFFSADSVRLEYAPRTFLSGDVVLSKMTVWQGTVVIRKDPGEEEFNVDRMLKDREPEPGPSRTILFRDVTLHDSRVLVYYPVPEGVRPGSREVVISTEDGDGRLRRLEFRRIEAGLPQVVVSSPEAPGPMVEVASLSLAGRIYEDPFRVVGFEGDVRWADSRLSVDFSRLRLPGTEARGEVRVDFTPEEGPSVSVRLQAPELALSDLQWLEPRLPTGRGRGEVELHLGPEGRRWRFADLDLTVEESRIAGEGVVLEGGRRGLVFQDVSLELSPLALHRLEPFLAEPLPVEGVLRGRASFSGTLDRLQARGRLTLDTPDRAPSTADFAGILHLERPLGATDLEATLDPFDFGLAADIFPALAIRGPGRVELQATGRLGEGLRFTADVVHRPADLPRSHVVASGTVRQRGEELVLDVESDVQPLSLTALRTYYPSLPVSGEVSGRIATRGPLSDLTITTDLDTEAGELDVVARLNARDPRAFYRVEGEVANFHLSRIVPGLPEATVVNGYVFLEGRGTDAATLRLTGRLRGHDSRVGDLLVDTVYAAVRVAEGVLWLDTLDAVAGGVRVDAQGTLAVAEGEPAGEIRMAFESDSLAPLRSVFFGEEIITRDDLTEIDRRRLEMEGIDPDTLPLEAEVAVGGRVRGQVTLRGSVRDFSAEGVATFEEVRYGTHYVGGAEVAFSAERLPGLEGEFRARVEADSLEIRGRAFSRADVELAYREPAGEQPGGEFELFLERNREEDYRARAVFEVDTAGGVVHLGELALRFDTLRWELVAPASVAWTDRGLTLDGLRLARAGVEDGMSLRAEGTLPFEGPADFTLEVRELSLERLARLLQADSVRYGGVVDLDMRVTGRAEAPVLTGTVAATDLRYEGFMLDRVEGDFDYADRQVALDLDAWRNDLRVLVARGTVPVDLSFREVETRIPEEPIDLDVVADSFPAALALSFFEAFADVEGTVAGEFHIGGTVENASPSGTLRLQNAAVTFPALGVRHTDIGGTLTLSPDGTVDVDARARSGGGTGVVTGTLTLSPLTDPTFDLDIALREFRAVNRSDVEGTVTGEMDLQGTYRRPFLEGALTVDRGVLYVEEFQRSAQVVDLSDPAFFDVVDTTLITAPPLLGQAQNPFLRNLRMDVDLRVERDTWLRSADMNVEIGGELLVAYDRGRGDLVLVGELEAIRGSYTLYGRRFVVQEGTVEFVGTPGINPDLGIVATNRIRQIDGEPLAITATVSGTLNNPRVVLSSPESVVAQSDLVSYLIFGRPAYELASGEAAVVEGAAGRLVGTAAGAGLTLGLGTLASRLGTLLGQEWEWLDYVAITQTQEFSLAGLGLGSTLAGTQVELGRYLSEDLFAVLVLRPLVDVGQTSGSKIAGLRLEWTVTDTYTVEAFWEDRFLRRRTFGFGQLGVQTSKVLGFLLYREWGY